MPPRSAARPSAGDLADRVAELADKHRVPGAQLAVRDGADTVSVQVGERCWGSGEPVKPDTAFPLGSVSKVFTATGAMILVTDGDVELDVPLGEYLPDLPVPCSAITLVQVLSHTGGLVADPEDHSGAGHSGAGHSGADASIRRYAQANCRAENLLQPPGTAFSYSNLGYVLAGRLVEAVTGMSWWDAMESILLRPLGIEPAFVAGPDRPRQTRELATGHSVNASAGRTRPVAQTLDAARAPAGGLAASALDLAALGRILLGRILSGGGPSGEDGPAALLPDEYARRMRQAVPAAEPFGIADGWGLGVALFRNGHGAGGDTASVGHDGNAEGTACYLRAEPSTGRVVAFTSNATTGLAMWRELAADLGVAALPTAGGTGAVIGAPGAGLSGCAGSYHNGAVEYAVAVSADGGMELLVDGEPLARLAGRDDDGTGSAVPFAQQDLETGEWTAPGRFLRDPVTGEVDRIQVDGRIARRRQDRASGERRRC